MPEMISPVANVQFDPNKQLSSLSTILGMKQQQVGIQQQQQALQTGQYQQQTAQAQAVQQQQLAKETQNGAQLLADPIGNGILDASGNPTKDSYQRVLSAMPTTGAAKYNDLVTGAKAHVDFKDAWNSLRTNEQNNVSSRMQGVAAGATRLSDLYNGINAIRDTYKGAGNEDDINQLTDSVKTAIDQTADHHGLQGAKAVVLGLSRGGLGNAGLTGASGISTPQATSQDLQGQIQPGVTAPAIEGGGFTPTGLPIRKTIPPGWTVTEDPVTHNKYIFNQQTGQTKPFGAQFGGGGAGGPQRAAGGPPVANAPPQRQPGEGEAQAAAKVDIANTDAGRYAQVSQEGTNATTGAQLADQVSQLADEVRTGKLTKEWADRLTVLRQHDPSVTDRQMLNKYAAQLKTMATQNATTDASRSQIDEGMPTPETMDPDSVKQAAQYVGGIFRMRGARQAYADQYVKNNNGSPLGIQGPDNAFMHAADPTAFAYKSLPVGQARQDFARQHGLTDPAKAKEFAGRLNQINHYGQ